MTTIQKNTNNRVVRASRRAKHHARHLLVPHKGNEFRPHLIRVHGIVAVLTVALLAQVVYGFATTGHFQVLGRVSTMSIESLLEDTNAERQKEGIPALTLNDRLNQAAFLKGEDMLEHDYWAHTSPSGVTPWQWLGDVGYTYKVAGENLAKNYPTASATVAAWMASPSHRENVMNKDYIEVGFAVVDGDLAGKGTTLIVAYYGSPASGIASPSSATPVENAPPVNETPVSFIDNFMSAVQSLSPVSVAIVGLLGVVAMVGAVAHHYRKNLPRSWKRSWRLHHGMFTFWGMIALGILIILATGGGSI